MCVFSVGGGGGGGLVCLWCVCVALICMTDCLCECFATDIGDTKYTGLFTFTAKIDIFGR